MGPIENNVDIKLAIDIDNSEKMEMVDKREVKRISSRDSRLKKKQNYEMNKVVFATLLRQNSELLQEFSRINEENGFLKSLLN